MRKTLAIFGWALLLTLSVCPRSLAQVIGVQPLPEASYYWNTSTSAWTVCPNASTANAAPTTPEPVANYGLNSSLGQYTPFTGVGSCPGSSSVSTGSNYAVPYYGLLPGSSLGPSQATFDSTGANLNIVGQVSAATVLSSSLVNTGATVGAPIAIVGTPVYGSNYSIASITLSGGTCSVAPAMRVWLDTHTGSVYPFVTVPGLCTVSPTATISGSTVGSTASVVIGLQSNVVAAGVNGLLGTYPLGGSGAVATGYGATLQNPVLFNPVIEILPGDATGNLLVDCNGAAGVQPLISLTSAMVVQILNQCASSIYFYPNGSNRTSPGASVIFGGGTQNGQAAAAVIEINAFSQAQGLYQNGIVLSPSFSATYSLPQPLGFNFNDTSAGGTLVLGALGGGTGYSGTGSCALSGGTIVTGVGDTCTVSLVSGSVVPVIVGSTTYSQAPLVTITGYSGGANGTLVGFAGLSSQLSTTASFWMDTAGAFHFSTAPFGTTGSDFATLTKLGALTVNSCVGCIAGGVLGSVPYMTAAGATNTTAAQTSSSTLCLVETGTGSVGAAPTWGSCGSAGSVAFSALTSATNTAAAMLVGTGASLGATGSGSITATAMAASGLTGAVPIAHGGTNATSAAAGTVPNASSGTAATWTSTLTLGASGTLGSVAMGNGTSGTVTLAPVTGALGSVTASLPANTGTLAELNFAQTWSALQTFGTSISIGGVTPSGATGSGNLVFGTSPSLVTPAIGAATATSLLASGIVDGEAPTTVTTTINPVVGASFKSGYYFNEFATASTGVTYSLPTAASGLSYCFANAVGLGGTNTGTLELLTSASGQFIIFTDGTLSATGGFVISGGAARDSSCLVGVDSTHWMLYVSSGVWTKH